MAQCNYAAISALNVPAGFQAADFDNTINENEVANLTCSGTNEYLNPDPDGENILALVCAADGSFLAPATWPNCVVKCPIVAPPDGSGFNSPTG